MSIFNFEFNGQKFEIKAPTGTTLEQAKAVFDQQTASGGLTGFRVGDVLSPATQAAAGLAAAQSQLSQGLAALNNKLPAGTNLQSLTASIGTLGQGAGTQVASALQGGSAALNSLTTGASGVASSFSSALSGAGVDVATGRIASVDAAFASGGISGAVSAFSGKFGALTQPLAGAAGQVDSLASKAADTLSGLVKGTATNGINVADFAKQGPALSSIGNLNLPDVTGTLAQASKLVGQGADKITNALGVGKFGLDASQLERAGLVKPGTTASFLAAGEQDLVGVLKSPTVWTGKDGVKNLDGLLKNSGLQDKVQQGLMKTGLNDLKSLGIPTDKMTPQALSGLATNAAKSVPNTVDWAKNVPGLPADVKSKFDASAVNGAFAVNLTQTKIDAPVLQETKPPAAVDTVNTDTLDAASKRVIGNERVPEVSSTNVREYPAISAFKQFIDSTYASFTALKNQIDKTNAEYQKITQDQWNLLNTEAVTLRAAVRARINDLNTAALKEYETIPDVGQTYGQKNAVRQYNNTLELLEQMTTLSEQIRALLKELAFKIAPQAQATGQGGG